MKTKDLDVLGASPSDDEVESGKLVRSHAAAIDLEDFDAALDLDLDPPEEDDLEVGNARTISTKVEIDAVTPEEIRDEPENDELEEEEEDDDQEEFDVQDHLKDAVEGSFVLKRLLTREDDEQPKKKRKLFTHMQTKAEQALAKELLEKWRCQSDKVLDYVLSQLPMDELDSLNRKYHPDKYNQWKSAAELMARHVNEAREKKLAGGGSLDAIQHFKFRHNLDAEVEQKIRALPHKDLRYVLDNFDGSRAIEEVIKEAAATPQRNNNTTTDAMPHAEGIGTYNRFSRLELIDPAADCAVFGDANLTFSLKLAKHRNALGHVGRVIATTFEELETLRERYKEIDDIILELETHLVEVFHGVDCTRIALNPHFKGLEKSLGVVYYNFPHSGAIQGFFDGHPLVNWRHENLMRLFFRALRAFMKPGGTVKVSSNMGAVGVRYSYIVNSAIQNEFTHVETMPFMEWKLHRYGRSYGDRRDQYKRPDAVNNQSYNAQRGDADMVYCFKFEPSGEKLPQQSIRLPPTLNTLLACEDGPFTNLYGDAKMKLATQLHHRFLTEISGTHVG
eukprot:TRINITY_DN25959_c0_g1_i1.p1 TRINITY_DN25959_c0_g1~~TRINITY_DN25959_c0_g1_i1.p1  ORF type:complete len:562 (-),score=121.44 TRINITY_DN25959_c0_g1_i1:147-1832(-)